LRRVRRARAKLARHALGEQHDLPHGGRYAGIDADDDRARQPQRRQRRQRGQHGWEDVQVEHRLAQVARVRGLHGRVGDARQERMFEHHALVDEVNVSEVARELL
jgi:hypothetical protein